MDGRSAGFGRSRTSVTAARLREGRPEKAGAAMVTYGTTATTVGCC